MTLLNRRAMLGASAALAGAAALPARAATAANPAEPMTIYQPVGLELALNIIATCSDPEPTGGPETKAPSRDGVRAEIWPIIGGRFWGKGPDGQAIRGIVVPGGGDFPVARPDGADWVDALYRLKTDDGVTIVIHNKGIGLPTANPDDEKFRLSPEFYAPAGKYAWLNKGVFVATLVWPMPPGLSAALGPHENDRLIQVFRVT